MATSGPEEALRHTPPTFPSTNRMRLFLCRSADPMIPAIRRFGCRRAYPPLKCLQPRQNVTACRNDFFGFLFEALLSVSAAASFIKVNDNNRRVSESRLAGDSRFLILAAMATRRPPRVRCGIVANDLLCVCADRCGVVAAALAHCGCSADDAGGDHVAGGRRHRRRCGAAAARRADDLLQPGGPRAVSACVDDPQPGQLTDVQPDVGGAERDGARRLLRGAVSLHVHPLHLPLQSRRRRFASAARWSTLAAVTLGTPSPSVRRRRRRRSVASRQDNASCICSGLACAAEETQVPNCSATAAGACGSRGG